MNRYAVEVTFLDGTSHESELFCEANEVVHQIFNILNKGYLVSNEHEVEVHAASQIKSARAWELENREWPAILQETSEVLR